MLSFTLPPIQLVHRLAEGLALDVPQRLVDGADPAIDSPDRRPAPKGASKEGVPHLLDAAGIGADHKPLHHLLEHSHAGGAAGAISQGHLAEAIDPLVSAQSRRITRLSPCLLSLGRAS
jgi:hypothetical protein